MSYKNTIADMKCETFQEANEKAVLVRNTNGDKIGRLVPVGNWILEDKEKIELIRAWRQRTMRMFLTQFDSTYERTYQYLKNFSIAQEGRIFFMLYDESERLVGHIGMAEVDGNSGELDNLMRGVDGGDPRLIYFSELALLDWSFKNLDIRQSDVRVVSYNWLVISLHEEVGYVLTNNFPLKKYEKDSVLFHDIVDETESNVKYGCTKMLLDKEDFYMKASWLV
ncbi:hypothetical protein FHI69_15210 [Janthinobacterium lividum]|uniref:N-acetyltransferase domain-containing protein n=1 Tax=Janthinobacterium lividum TaxID=29581 RepID=A0A5C4NQW7_9BURK|nr:hypothetical protein [Janthinobacterium lividum]TNC76285.1 hypothetical protein FHI69_15210 [Janthinobacterium lividum]